MKKTDKSSNKREVENTCVVCKNKIEFPEATFIFRSKETSRVTIYEFCSGECVDSYGMTVGEIMLNVEKAIRAEINNNSQDKLEDNNLKGGPKK